ncbi:MAG: hypothetical protein LBD21_05620 [Tannerellaceae bacterium]|jgi:hypothetical protein|nr:hypothetical protein [Tannerellaceae bacterium]
MTRFYIRQKYEITTSGKPEAALYDSPLPTKIVKALQFSPDGLFTLYFSLTDELRKAIFLPFRQGFLTSPFVGRLVQKSVQAFLSGGNRKSDFAQAFPPREIANRILRKLFPPGEFVNQILGKLSPWGNSPAEFCASFSLGGIRQSNFAQAFPRGEFVNRILGKLSPGGKSPTKTVFSGIKQ